MFALAIVAPKKYAPPFLLSLRWSFWYQARWHHAWAYRSLPSKGSHLINPMACYMAFENTNKVSAIIWSLHERIAPLVHPLPPKGRIFLKSLLAYGGLWGWQLPCHRLERKGKTSVACNLRLQWAQRAARSSFVFAMSHGRWDHHHLGMLHSNDNKPF